MTAFLVALGVFALICLIGWLRYRAICRGDAQQHAVSGRYAGRTRL